LEKLAVAVLGVQREHEFGPAWGRRPPSSSIRPVPGRAAQALAIDATPYPSLDITDLSTDDLKAIAVVLKKYSADAAELAESGELPLGAGSVGASGSRQR